MIEDLDYSMPFTPYHFGAPLTVIGVSMVLLSKQQKYLKIRENISLYLAMLAGSVVPDLQGFYSIFFDQSVPLHGFSHTLLGGITYSLIFSIIQQSICKYCEMRQKYLSLYFTWFGSIITFHIIPDMFIYPDLHIFAPLSSLNIGNLDNYSLVASTLSVMWVIGGVLILIGYLLSIRFEGTSK